MIVELFGLPGSGKTTIARSFAKDGAVVVPAQSFFDIAGEGFIFLACHPMRAVRFFFFVFRNAPIQYRALLLTNLFFASVAKYARAKRLSRRGGIVVIDQGPFQTFLSLFEEDPSETALRKLLSILPKPDILIALSVSEEERVKRIEKRGRAVRPSAGEAVYPRALKLFSETGLPHTVVPGMVETKLQAILTSRITYVSVARMPTEKAHGVSIAHMCHEFAKRGIDTTLLVPQRKNPISEDVYAYYGVPHDFHVAVVPSVDFLGRGYTNPPFFFLQRIMFLLKLSRTQVPWGTIYTREPEIALHFSKTHRVVFEAHRWPRGFAGVLQAQMLRHAALVVCNSQGTEKEAKRFGVLHTLVAPNGFDPEQFLKIEKTRPQLGLPEGVLALYAGSDGVGKGAEIVRLAAKQLESSGIAVGIIGTGKKQLSPPLYELGRVAQPVIPSFLMAADILTLPNTREGESEHYTSPIKLFEYLGAGKAIIASDLPSIREILGDSDALFVTPGDAKALANAIEKLARDVVLRSGLAARTKALSASYTWEARAQKILATLLS